eukprot:387272_1
MNQTKPMYIEPTQGPPTKPGDTLYSAFSRHGSKFEIRQLLQQIESNIQFTNATSSVHNQLYSTGHSPHYYNGPYDLNKTSKHIRFPYLCQPGTVNLFSNWTFRLNEAALTPEAKGLLHELQHLGFYNNLHTFFMDNLHRYSSPYVQPMNVFWFGNSYRKQVHQSMFAFIDALNNTQIDDIIHSFHIFPIRVYNESRSMGINADNVYSLRCDG